MHESIRKFAEDQVRRNNAIIEQAVEESLQRGDHGVFVEERGDGTVVATVHPRVPYGNVYYGPFPAEEFTGGGRA